ncbi:MAG: glycosyltransferase family 4 protein [bacterium]|nr:glycosyltransferase family 4 protein [bacterium]
MTMNKESKQTKGVVCHLSSVHIWFDTRVFYKECRSLAEEGYEVRLVARKEDGERVTVDNVEVIPFGAYKNRFIRILFSSFRMFKIARKQKARIYHFHDPELLVVGILLKLTGKKVIYDSHEDYSQQLMYKTWLKWRWVIKLIARCFAVFEWFAIFFCDRIITANQNVEKTFPSHKTINLRNVPILQTIDQAEPPAVEKTKPVIIYAGALAQVRGIKEIIRAMTLITTDAELWLLGKWESDAFRGECENLEGWKSVRYMGLKKPHEVYGYMKVADIGLSVLHPIKNYLGSEPVKAFEYLACGIPMIMSDFPYWREIFGDCALYSDPASPESIAANIQLLLDSEEKRETLGKTGETLIREHYSWEMERKRLVALYDGLLAGRKKK